MTEPLTAEAIACLRSWSSGAGLSIRYCHNHEAEVADLTIPLGTWNALLAAAEKGERYRTGKLTPTEFQNLCFKKENERLRAAIAEHEKEVGACSCELCAAADRKLWGTNK